MFPHGSRGVEPRGNCLLERKPVLSQTQKSPPAFLPSPFLAMEAEHPFSVDPKPDSARIVQCLYPALALQSSLLIPKGIWLKSLQSEGEATKQYHAGGPLSCPCQPPHRGPELWRHREGGRPALPVAALSSPSSSSSL